LGVGGNRRRDAGEQGAHDPPGSQAGALAQAEETVSPAEAARLHVMPLLILTIAPDRYVVLCETGKSPPNSKKIRNWETWLSSRPLLTGWVFTLCIAPSRFMTPPARCTNISRSNLYKFVLAAGASLLMGMPVSAALRAGLGNTVAHRSAELINKAGSASSSTVVQSGGEAAPA